MKLWDINVNYMKFMGRTLLRSLHKKLLDFFANYCFSPKVCSCRCVNSGKKVLEMEDWAEHVRKWENKLAEIDQKIEEANQNGMNGRKMYQAERDNVSGLLGNAQDLVRGR
jgi:hypothetical protein